MNGLKLPRLWKPFQIGDLCEAVENTAPEQRGEGNFRYVDISSINNEQKVITSVKIIANKEAPSRARQIISVYDVLVSTVRPNLNAVAIVPENLDGAICSTGFCVLRAKQEILDPEFLFAWVRYPNFIKALVRLQQGIGYPAVRDKDIKQTDIPLPPLPEQRRIVEILREADELRRLRSQSINKLEKLFNSLFFYYFETGKPNSKYSETIKLRELLAVPLTSGYSPNTHNEPPGIPVFGLNAITNFGLDPMKIKYYPEKTYKGKGDDLQPDDILVTRSNTQELVGKVARYRGEPSPVIYPDLMIRIRLKNSKDSPYVESFLRSVYMTDIIQRLARGTSGSMKKISQKDINDFDILYPPEKDRYEYADRVRELEQLYEYYSLDAKKLDDLFQSLLAQAFTGELTATWREQHEEELAAAAAERDRLLQISQPVDTEELADEEASETKTSELHRDRDELLRSLSKRQWKIYELVIQETAYFTPEHLEEKYSIPRNIGHKSLQLLAAAGLIIPVTLPTPTSSGLHYESAYRNLNQDDDTRYSDDALLEKDAV